ncbi:alkanesulfonate monooxygenase SsuD/methylene tetrahydromethanopterin reductase-like flavin-dependent oxidoreductase (luciferase family) [Amycolatopsis bartoniae]|uniref:N5,N10-methylene tetrahydromethanopterin reductase n=1 Tax=Amycolatopsis bartoniae TaxID=941986 RepID=A0A8H9J2L6_9PSEU|nr:LLM class flavin-dependent oxidoreductase [Amycolatopsis bartoniae]MBB2939016.1 alkanesulfonate monooxygenase SsuD/methylene tetrahydromethanopterin reductase-like flavin-dependent oxidoreductase (luciferase family) [Amycolatopsis bartoniae]GHF65576.1 N5,N10-methylene tetrahydromethanopterin reductase [Amycolatopsis bartoniae]
MSRLGLRIPRELPARRVTDLARRAERAGLDEVWIVEDCFYAGAIAIAATVLSATEHVTVGIGVLPTVARNPAIAAMELAALADLYPGRLIAGFGHGVPAWMRQIGAYPASPLAALDETLTAIRRLLAGEEVTTDGRHVHLDAVRLEFPPAVAPPLFAGVRGPKSLAVGGKAADGTILAEPATPEYVRATREIVGERHTITTYNWFALDDDPARARARVRADLVAALTPSTGPHLRPLPFGEELFALIRQGRADELRDEWIDRLTISGPLDQCAAQRKALHDAGSESVVLLPLLAEPLEDAISAAGELARHGGTPPVSGPSPV